MTDVDRPHRAPAAGRAVVWTQFALLVAYLIGSFGVLILAAVRSGDPAAILHPGLERLGDPKESLPGLGPDSVANPLVWIFGVCRLIAWFVYPLGIAMLLFGVVTLVPSWRRGDRRTFARLAVLTTVWLVLILLAVSPYGQDLMGWLLD
ncbi:hypothetical protein [Actinoplanes siamensis]|uniref:Uncharacterized protein n=1 Tax=Actinoplanes siamensis TaxID=1223317 RepID=A0A919TJ14_9ACTN|nr:hypothetical protein [Actinoplanes siamensis]GIF04134.1 hypothetical protein Asi03nite_16720 [Actinoplanes siamensis]